jgi:citrate/tricarballylate utilization protein
VSSAADARDKSINDLFVDAERQLNICNACRYCEGYCAVFPALERRTLLTRADMNHLANLCHDCRACFYACMYAAPHPFDLNPPQVLSRIRLLSYEGTPETGKRRLPAILLGWSGTVLGFVVAAVILVVVAVATNGAGSLWNSGRGPGSPYMVLPYPALLAIAILPFLAGVGLMIRDAVRYWHQTHGSLADLLDIQALSKAVAYAGELRYMRGGGAECPYPTDQGSAARLRLHSAIFYGFTALLLSTISAGVLQDIIGSEPPYSFVSVPVVLGILGGASMVIGCTGLLVLKRRADRAPSDVEMAARDVGFLLGLEALGLTGLLTLAVRSTPAYGIALVVHLAAVVLCFAAAPYTKFVHFVYRFLAIVKDNLERTDAGA